jgi:lipopolysaccharide export system permease protein
MRLIDRYLLRQLVGPTLLATAALTAVALLSQSLSGLDLIVNQRQSALVFLKITLLYMPQLINMILPISLFVATLVALNRLHTEQEIVVCFAGGMSRWRVISPAMRLSVMVALVSLVLTLWIQPLSYRAMRVTLQGVRADLAATMVKPGRFTHPAAGLTVYAQSSVDDDGYRNIFIHQDNGQGRATTVTAREGRLEKRQGAPVLIMKHGANQSFSRAGVLNYLSLDEYVFDLRDLMSLDQTVHYKLSDRYLHELFFPDLRNEWERKNQEKMLAEGHSRLAAPLYNIALMAMALAAVLGGSFSRFGYAARMGAVAGAAVVVRSIGFAVQAAAAGDAGLNLLQYAVPLAATAYAFFVIFRNRPRRRAKTPPQGAAAPAGALGSPA